jgi:hypothetical protein
MELRHHPLLSYRGLASWPPVWVPAKPDDGKSTLRGEIGVLKHTISNALSGKCYLLIDHQNSSYIGSLFCADAAFCSQIAAALEDNRGRTIKEIGDLDLSFTL